MRTPLSSAESESLLVAAAALSRWDFSSCVGSMSTGLDMPGSSWTVGVADGAADVGNGLLVFVLVMTGVVSGGGGLHGGRGLGGI